MSRFQTIKIADFGLSRFLNGEKYYFGKNSKFPILWTPPEFWEDQKKLGKAKRFSTKSDVWGFGVTMWEMFSHGKRPWEGREHEVLKAFFKKNLYNNLGNKINFAKRDSRNASRLSTSNLGVDEMVLDL